MQDIMFQIRTLWVSPLCFATALGACSVDTHEGASFGEGTDNGSNGDNDGGGAGSGDDAGDDNDEESGNDGDTDDDVRFDVGTADAGGVPGGCPETTGDIFVINETDLSLYRFHPPAREFVLVGTPDCGAGIQPFSMGVSRDALAYVLYVDQTTNGCDGIFEVDVLTGACGARTPFVCGDQGFSTFGMGYSTNASGGTDESLFVGTVNDGAGQTASLARLDPSSGALDVVGSMQASGVEFTGNSLAQLWGFAAQDMPMHVIQVDKSTGDTLVDYSLEGIFGPGMSASATHWAWAFWGGDFYIFLRSAFDDETVVYRVFGETGSGPAGDFETYMESSGGLSIVGAGVSTCAPTVPPG